MSNLNFEAILNTQVAEIEAPKTAPSGAYHATVADTAVETLEAKGDKKEAYLFKVTQKIIGIADPESFASDELEEANGFAGKKITQTFYVNHDGEGIHRIKKFGLEVLKVQDGDSMTLSQLFDNFKNLTNIIVVERKEVMNKQNEAVVISEIKKNLPTE